MYKLCGKFIYIDRLKKKIQLSVANNRGLLFLLYFGL